MGYKIEMSSDSVTRSGSGVDHKYTPTGKSSSGHGVRAGDRFRRGRILSSRHLSGVTKSTNNSWSCVNSAWRHAAIKDDVLVVSTMERSNGEKLNFNECQSEDHSFDSPTRSCDHGVLETDCEGSPRHDELLAYIKEIRAKSKTLLYDVKQFRLDLRTYPF